MLQLECASGPILAHILGHVQINIEIEWPGAIIGVHLQFLPNNFKLMGQQIIKENKLYNAVIDV